LAAPEVSKQYERTGMSPTLRKTKQKKKKKNLDKKKKSGTSF